MAGILNNTPSVTANTPAIVTSTGEIIAANVKRKGFIVQNVGTNALFLRLGAAASTSVFHAVLKAGTGDSDGNGGSYSQMDGAIYQGSVTMTGTSPKCVVTELT